MILHVWLEIAFRLGESVLLGWLRRVLWLYRATSAVRVDHGPAGHLLDRLLTFSLRR